MYIAEELNNFCNFCRKQQHCKEAVMLKGINMIINEVAPSLELRCKEFDSILSNTPSYNRSGFPPASLTCKEVSI